MSVKLRASSPLLFFVVLFFLVFFFFFFFFCFTLACVTGAGKEKERWKRRYERRGIERLDRREYPQGTDLIFISTTGRSLSVRNFSCYTLGLPGTPSRVFSQRSPPSLPSCSRFIFNPDALPFAGWFAVRRSFLPVIFGVARGVARDMKLIVQRPWDFSLTMWNFIHSSCVREKFEKIAIHVLQYLLQRNSLLFLINLSFSAGIVKLIIAINKQLHNVALQRLRSISFYYPYVYA